MWHMVGSQQMIVLLPPQSAQFIFYDYLLYHSSLTFVIKSPQ